MQWAGRPISRAKTPSPAIHRARWKSTSRSACARSSARSHSPPGRPAARGTLMSTPIFPETLDTAARLAVAALVGLAVGIERQRSGHTEGPDQDFAGPRTFLLFGLLG